MTPQAYLDQLQAEAENGFHKGLSIWVDPKSSVAKFLAALDEKLKS